MAGLADARHPRRHGGQRLIEQQAVARSLVDGNIFVFIKLAPGYTGLSGQRMIATACGDEPFLQQDLEFDFGLLAAHEADAEIGFAADYRAEHFVGARVEQLDPDSRIAAVIGGNDARQEIVGNRRHACDGHMTQAARGDVADAEQRDIEVVQKLFCAWGEHASYGGERHAARGSLEKPHAERRFELLDAPAERRLRNVDCLRCFAEAAQLHDGSKRLQIVQVEVDAHDPSSAFYAAILHDAGESAHQETTLGKFSLPRDRTEVGAGGRFRRVSGHSWPRGGCLFMAGRCLSLIGATLREPHSIVGRSGPRRSSRPPAGKVNYSASQKPGLCRCEEADQFADLFRPA